MLIFPFSFPGGLLYSRGCVRGRFRADRQPADTLLSIPVAQFIGGGQGVFPALLAAAVEQIDLLSLRGERRGLHSEQAHLNSLLPILSEERTDLFKDFGIECVGLAACGPG